MPETTTDEQELAKALDNVVNLGGIAPAKPEANDNVHDSGMQPIVPLDSPVAPQAMQSDSPATVVPVTTSSTQTTQPQAPQDSTTSGTDSSGTSVADDVPVAPTGAVNSDSSSGPLDTIKNDALNELRPLVNKLDIKAEEKFDTYLLLIRSTDDMSLIEPAHEVAKTIEDEARRAQALLDIIKEIDYLSHKKDQ